MHKKTICLDFDGVIHSYTSPWLEADFIPDPPVPGALDFIKRVLEAPNYELKIFSSRSKEQGGIRAMQNWLRFWFIKEYGWEIGAGIGNTLRQTKLVVPVGAPDSDYWDFFPKEKPSAWLTIDDRGYQFVGTWPTFEEINNFKPWNKK